MSARVSQGVGNGAMRTCTRSIVCKIGLVRKKNWYVPVPRGWLDVDYSLLVKLARFYTLAPPFSPAATTPMTSVRSCSSN